jgi:hypothetical protein
MNIILEVVSSTLKLLDEFDFGLQWSHVTSTLYEAQTELYMTL